MCEVRMLDDAERRIEIMKKNGDVVCSNWYIEIEGRQDFAFTKTGNKVFTDLSSGIDDNDIEKTYISRKRESGVIYITDHAAKRLKERNGWNKKTALRMIKKIYETGIRGEDVKGYIAPWIRNKIATRNPGDEFVVYGTSCYVFNSGNVITVLPLPHKGKFLSR